MNLRLSGRVVFVAGASRGIGKAIARSFLAEGAHVAIAARQEDQLIAAAVELDDSDSRLLSFPCDLARPEDVERALTTIQQKWSHPDVVVANAGDGRGRMGWETEDVDWDSSLESNLRNSIRVARTFAGEMVARGSGSIVFVGSIAGCEALPAPLQYSAAKAALRSYTKNLARELGPCGVRVNMVAPGNVLFQGGSWDNRRKSDPEAVSRMLAAEVPLGRFGTPEEVADIVVFLGSDRSSFATGACWIVDGGQTRSM